MAQTPRSRQSHDDQTTVPGWALVLREQLSALTEKVVEIKESLDSTERTLHGKNGDRGLVTRVSLIEQKLEEIAADVRTLRTTQNTLPRSAAGGEENYISWRYIVDKLAVPITLTVIGFLLTVVLPSVLVLINLLPQILKNIGVQ